MYRDAVRLGDSSGLKEPGVQILQGKGQFLEVVQLIEKQYESMLHCTQQKKSITALARLLQPTALLPTELTISLEKL